MMTSKYLLKSPLSEGFADCVLRFDQAIGVQQKAVAVSDRYFTNRIYRIFHHSKDDAVAFDVL